jgi:hypothetical protein
MSRYEDAFKDSCAYAVRAIMRTLISLVAASPGFVAVAVVGTDTEFLDTRCTAVHGMRRFRFQTGA